MEERNERREHARVIRLHYETFERFRGWAEPLGDTADSTMRKILDAAEERGPRFPTREWLLMVVRRFVGGMPEVAAGDRLSLAVTRRLVDHIMRAQRSQ